MASSLLACIFDHSRRRLNALWSHEESQSLEMGILMLDEKKIPVIVREPLICGTSIGELKAE